MASFISSILKSRMSGRHRLEEDEEETPLSDSVLLVEDCIRNIIVDMQKMRENLESFAVERNRSYINRILEAAGNMDVKIQVLIRRAEQLHQEAQQVGYGNEYD